MWGTPRRLQLLFATIIFLSTVFLLVNVYYQNYAKQSASDDDQSHAAALEDVSLKSDSEPIVCIFTTFKPVANKVKIYQNVLQNWALLGLGVKPILFTTALDLPNITTTVDGLNLTLPEIASYHGWEILPAPRLSKAGTPFIKDMFEEVANTFRCTFYGYSNGDILFDRGLVRTLDSISEILHVLASTLVVGRRTNFNVTERDVYHPDDVTRLGYAEGELFHAHAQDYFFIAHNQFPWRVVPDVVIGLPAYDNFLVATAIRQGVSVVDASSTLLALHQSDEDGNFAGHRRAFKNYNKIVIGRRFHSFRYVTGLTTRSQFVTKLDSSRSVAVFWRLRNTRVWPSFWKRLLFW